MVVLHACSAPSAYTCQAKNSTFGLKMLRTAMSCYPQPCHSTLLVSVCAVERLVKSNSICTILLPADNTHLTPAGVKGIIAGGIIFLITFATLLLIVRDIRERSGKASMPLSSTFVTACEGTNLCSILSLDVRNTWQPA